MEESKKRWVSHVPPLREETHFERPMQCYAERPRSLVPMLEAAVARNPDGEALVCGDTRLTWRALRERVAGAAGALARRGIGPGDRVAFQLANRVEFPVAFLAAAWLGAIAVPIGLREVKSGVDYILGHCGAKIFLGEGEAGLPGEP